MNNKALLQLGAELMHEFRHGDGPADRAIGDYVRARKFLGARDKNFLSDVFFHCLRNLRRIDESILSAFAGTIAAETRYSTGFPVTSELGARAWWRREIPEPESDKHEQRDFDRAVDTIRLGLAAVELGLEQPLVIADELLRCWPSVRTKVPVQAGSLQRMMPRAAEIMVLYAKSRKPADQDRTFSFPDWLWALLSEGREPEEMAALGASLAAQAPVTLRVNTLKATIEDVENALREANITFRRATSLPTAIHLEQRVGRQDLPRVADGWIEVQDEGSQWISVYTGAAPGMTVIDACAGAGGKSLHLATLMADQGRVLAFDSDRERLGRLDKRIERCGVTIIDRSLILNARGEPPPDTPLADIVLVDAPCSGTGTIRRAPDIRWRLSPAGLEIYRQAQRDLLDRWAHHVRPGGALVYATCSLLAAENERQTEAFLKSHPGWTITPPENFPGPVTKRGELRLQPHLDGCDGFYAARFMRPA